MWSRFDAGCCSGSNVAVDGGFLRLGSGFGEAPGASDHKVFVSNATFSPLGEGLVARSRVRFGGDYQNFGVGFDTAFRSGPNGFAAYFDTLERAADHARANFVHTVVISQDVMGTWHTLFQKEVPASWYDVFHQLAIEWHVSSVPFLIDRTEVGVTPVPLACRLHAVVSDNRPQLMETDWVEVHQIGMPTNLPPTVNARPDVVTSVHLSVSLVGSVSDGGFPSGNTVTSQWTKVSGPGDVAFADPAQALTTATFSVPGSYVLRLTASDGHLGACDDAVWTVNTAPPANQPPTVAHGPDQTGSLPAAA